MRLTWSDREGDAVIKAYQSSGLPMLQFATQYSKVSRRSPKAIEMFLHKSKMGGRIALKPSPYPSYSEPLVMEGDALILTDVEFPFHHAPFLNKCLALAEAWGVRNLILGGDLLHFENLSRFDPNWVATNESGMSEGTEAMLMETIRRLPSKYQAELMAVIGEMPAPAHEGLSDELTVARRELKKLASQFDKIDFVLGNHEGRLLRAVQAALNPQELLHLLDATDPKWRISPYYFSILVSNGEKYIIEHPKNSGKFSASKLASKYQAHIIMGHSHQWAVTFDPSGKFYAIETGHCVDETKLPYASQRHNASPAHILGATIVKDGYPTVLHERINWDALMVSQ